MSAVSATLTGIQPIKSSFRLSLTSTEKIQNPTGSHRIQTALPNHNQESSQFISATLSSPVPEVPTTSTSPTKSTAVKKEQTDDFSKKASALGLTIGLSIGIPVAAFVLFVGGGYVYFFKLKLINNQVNAK